MNLSIFVVCYFIKKADIKLLYFCSFLYLKLKVKLLKIIN